MNDKFYTIISQYNSQVLKVSSLDTGKDFRFTFSCSETDKAKLTDIQTKYNMGLSEVVRYAIHHLTESIK